MDKAPLAFSMTLADPQQAAILGLTPPKPKVTNVFQEATELDKLGDEASRAKAEKIYLELLNADFNNSVLLAALGMNYASRERSGAAHCLLQRALANVDNIVADFKKVGVIAKAEKADQLDIFIANKRAEILNAIGTCFKHENNVSAARDYFLKAQESIPLNADIQNNLGTLFINEGKPEKALEHLELATKLEPEHPQACWNQSLAQLELGNYEKGWALYDYGFAAKVRAERDYTKIPLPRWDGSPDKRVVVYGEQGIGDEILFASCLPELIKTSKQVVFDCHKKLHQLFCDSFPGLDIFPTREDPYITWTGKYEFDARIAIGSLPKFFRPTPESCPGTPYIIPNIAKEAEWAVKLAKLGDKPKVGISWIGGHKRTRVEVRSIELERWLPILKQQGAEFISLQYTEGCDQEIAAFEAKHGIKIHYFPEASHSPNYADCAALVANLDLVISVATSVIHLAGSMGVPCWVLTASRAAWREYYGGDSNPWYKSLTMFRQAQGSVDWEPVIQEVSEALGGLLEGVKHA